MKIKFIRQYRKQGGNMVFVYGVHGTPEQIAEYKEVKGANFREDEKTKEPLFFGQRFIGPIGTIEKNKEGTDWRVDTTHADQLKSLTDQGYSYDQAKDMMKVAE
jgi:hypothetical protein